MEQALLHAAPMSVEHLSLSLSENEDKRGVYYLFEAEDQVLSRNILIPRVSWRLFELDLSCF